MQKKILKAVAISPIFSYRKSNDVELRATEWKALMRSVFRWASLEEKTNELYNKETEYFGGSRGENGYASPIRLQIMGDNVKNTRGYLVDRHDKRVWGSCYPAKTQFDIIFRKYLAQGQSLEWYENMFKLSIILSGVGKRSRRGRGAITLEGMPKNKNKLIIWLTEQLNDLNESNEKSPYHSQGDRIENSVLNRDIKRPIIEKVIIGNEIKKVDIYLKEVDQTAHDVKNLKKKVFLTGNSFYKKRFASSLIVSIAQTGDGKKYPIYTFLKPVFEGKEQCTKNDDRKTFLKKLKEKREGKF